MATWTNVAQLNMRVGRGNQGRLVFLRRFVCSEPGNSLLMDMEGIEALNGTAVQTFHQLLLGVGLPFRVNIRGKIETHKHGIEQDRKITWFKGFRERNFDYVSNSVHFTAVITTNTSHFLKKR